MRCVCVNNLSGIAHGTLDQGASLLTSNHLSSAMGSQSRIKGATCCFFVVFLCNFILLSYRLSVAVLYRGRIKLWITLIENYYLVDWSPEKDCCWQLTFQQPLRKPFEESRWLPHRLLKRQPPTTVLLRTLIS